MIRRTVFLCIFVGASALLAGCEALPGQPRPGSETLAPDEISDFNALYGQNCAGCHSLNGGAGPAVSLNDPLYLRIVTTETLRRITREGISGSLMPAFAKSAGGMLTDQQIEILVAGIRERAAKTAFPLGVEPPSYAAPSPGDAQRGAEVFRRHCADCHGADGQGTKRGGSVVDQSFLALVSDQGLRTLVIVGQPELGMPGWRVTLIGAPMSATDISDVVAWLASKRTAFPGQPYPSPTAGGTETR